MAKSTHGRQAKGSVARGAVPWSLSDLETTRGIRGYPGVLVSYRHVQGGGRTWSQACPDVCVKTMKETGSFST